MTTRVRFMAVADQIPLPLETVGGIAAAILAQFMRRLGLPEWARPIGLALTSVGIVLVISAWRGAGPGVAGGASGAGHPRAARALSQPHIPRLHRDRTRPRRCDPQCLDACRLPGERGTAASVGAARGTVVARGLR